MEMLDPQRPWRWSNWKKSSAKDRIWILLMSSEMFWIMFMLSIVASVMLAISLGNHWVSEAGWRHALEVVMIVTFISSALLLMLLIFEITFHVRDFVCHRILKSR